MCASSAFDDVIGFGDRTPKFLGCYRIGSVLDIMQMDIDHIVHFVLVRNLFDATLCVDLEGVLGAMILGKINILAIPFSPLKQLHHIQQTANFVNHHLFEAMVNDPYPVSIATNLSACRLGILPQKFA